MISKEVNRIEFDLNWWADQDKRLDKIFTPTERAGKSFDKARHAYYKNVYRRYRPQRKYLTESERGMLKYLRDAIEIQRPQVHKYWVPRTYHRIKDRITNINNWLRSTGPAHTPGYYDQVQQQKAENTQQLHKALKDHGFEQAIPEVERQMKAGVATFNVPISNYLDDDKSVNYTLHFKKVDDNGIYAFEKYDANLAYESNPALNRSQTFRVVDNQTIRSAEARNLLEGRAIEQGITDAQGNTTHTWLKINFSDQAPDGSYRYKWMPPDRVFDLEKAAAGLPLQELNTMAKSKELFDTLRAGGIYPVTADVGMQELKLFAVADPHEGVVKLLNKNMVEVRPEDLPQMAQEQAKAQQQSQQQQSPEQQQQQQPMGPSPNAQLNIQTNGKEEAKLNNRKPLVIKQRKSTSVRKIGG